MATETENKDLLHSLLHSVISMHKQSITLILHSYGKEKRILYSQNENGIELTHYFVEGHCKIQGLWRGDKINSSLL